MGSKPRPSAATAAVAPIADAGTIASALAKTWGHAVCELDFSTPFGLLVATILSAQSTDKRVNMVTPALLARFPDARTMAAADPSEVEVMVHSTGFYRAKTRNLLAMARMLVENFGGEVPRSMSELVTLPGVARKTANVVLGIAYGIAAGVVVDTHVKRVAARLGLTANTDPVKIERDLCAAFDQDKWIDIGTQLIWHGRRVCHARKPSCQSCTLAPLCPSRELL